LGFLLSLLMVFKTQFSYTQFWTALGHVDGLVQDSRSLAMTACAIFDWDKDPMVQVRARRIVRFLVLHFFVIVEFFQRTGQNATTDTEVQDQLREDVRALTGEHEFRTLYPDHVDRGRLSGSLSDFTHTNPTLVVYWIYLAAGGIMKDGGCPPPVMACFIAQVNSLMGHFWGMQKIDKTQFPLPYAQVVKIVVIVFIYFLPFFMAPGLRYLTPVVSLLLTIGFFGLDEVAEILESPFGNDPNDIDLDAYGQALMDDLQIIYHSRNVQLDTVFTDDRDLDFSRISSRTTTSNMKHELGFATDRDQSTFFKVWCEGAVPSRRSVRSSRAAVSSSQSRRSWESDDEPKRSSRSVGTIDASIEPMRLPESAPGRAAAFEDRPLPGRPTFPAVLTDSGSSRSSSRNIALS